MQKRKTNTHAPTPGEESCPDPSHLQLLTVPEVAKLLAIGCTKVYELIAANELQTIKIGKARRVLIVSIWQYQKRQLVS